MLKEEVGMDGIDSMMCDVLATALSWNPIAVPGVHKYYSYDMNNRLQQILVFYTPFSTGILFLENAKVVLGSSRFSEDAENTYAETLFVLKCSYRYLQNYNLIILDFYPFNFPYPCIFRKQWTIVSWCVA